MVCSGTDLLVLMGLRTLCLRSCLCAGPWYQPLTSLSGWRQAVFSFSKRKIILLNRPLQCLTPGKKCWNHHPFTARGHSLKISYFIGNHRYDKNIYFLIAEHSGFVKHPKLLFTHLFWRSSKKWKNQQKKITISTLLILLRPSVFGAKEQSSPSINFQLSLIVGDIPA